MIHPTSCIDKNAKISKDVSIGPYSVIGPNVEIGSGTKVFSHVVIEGHTKIGKNNTFYQFSSIGANPQDKKYANEPTLLIIGDNNTFRENVTVNKGTIQDTNKTQIGNDNWIMAGVHIAHDCEIGNNCILANAVALAGHVRIDDWVILGGYTLVHQFCHIGEHSFCGMGSVISKDVPNFVTVSGNLAKPKSINSEGLKRRGYDTNQIKSIKKAYSLIYRSKLRLENALIELEKLNDDKNTLSNLINFLKTSTRGIIR